LRRVGPEPRRGDGGGARSVGARLQAGWSRGARAGWWGTFFVWAMRGARGAAVVCRTIFSAGEIGDRSAADNRCGAVRNRLGTGWIVPGAGLGKPGDAVARGHGLCRGDGRRHGGARRVATAAADGATRARAGERGRWLRVRSRMARAA